MKLLIFTIFVLQVLIVKSNVEYDKKFLFSFLFHRETNVRYFLFTRQNAYAGREIFMDDIDSLLMSSFNPSNPTKFLIHGWGGDMETPFNERVSTEFLIKDDINIIRVDWSDGAQTINYFTAANRVPAVGKQLGQFIDFLHSNNAVDFNNVTIIGFSLGAQVAGFGGKNTQRGKVGKIIGLDPAGPLFNTKDADGRLDHTDAMYVEVIHSNMGITGMTKLIGHADFIANDGTHQPGCLFLASCSHHRSTKFYIESINTNPFWAHRCNNMQEVNRRSCNGEIALLGDLSNGQNNLRGVFHFSTNRESPFSPMIPEI